MIELATEQLPDAARATLRKWLVHAGADVAAKLCHARCQLKQAEAIAEAVKEGSSNEARTRLSGDLMRQAARYSGFVEVLKELAADATDKAKLQLTKLKPYGSLQIQLPNPDETEG